MDHAVRRLGVLVERDTGCLGFRNLETDLSDYAFVEHDLIKNAETLHFAVSILDHLPNKVSFILKQLLWQERCAFLFAAKNGALPALSQTLIEEVAHFLGQKWLPEEDEEENEIDERQYLDLGDEESDEDEEEPEGDEPQDEAFDYEEEVEEEQD